MAQRLYIQTELSNNLGLLRSDNGGRGWKPVGGPSNVRDTRFVVTGCIGETVYAFDGLGNIYKTVDGGDGTLASPTGDPLSLAPDTVRIQAAYCQPSKVQFTFQNASCSEVGIDSIRIKNDSGLQFSIDKFLNALDIAATDTITVRFIPVHDGWDTASLIIYASQKGITVQKRIIITSLNATAPTPFLGTVTGVTAGNQTVIPIYIRPTKEHFRMTSYGLHLSMNGDLLTPQSIVLINTLSDGATENLVTRSANGGLECKLTLAQPISETSDLTKPLLYVTSLATLSDSLYTSITLDSFAINGLQPLSLCSNPQSSFTLQTQCGDSSLILSIGGGSLLKLLDVAPNPSHGGDLSVTYSTARPAAVILEVLDASGRIVGEPVESKVANSGKQTLLLKTSKWPSGDYFLRLRSGSETELRKLVQIR